MDYLYEIDPDEYDRRAARQQRAHEKARAEQRWCSCGGEDRGHSPDCQILEDQ